LGYAFGPAFVLLCETPPPPKRIFKKKGCELIKEKFPKKKMGPFVKLVSAVDRLLQLLLHPKFLGITSTKDGLEWRS